MVRLILALTLIFVAAAACRVSSTTNSPTSDNGNGGPLVTAVERPAGVPADATEVDQAMELGSIERQANEPPNPVDTRVLLTAACQDGVMTLFTDQEDIFAALPCDRFWNDETVQAFSSQEVAIRLTVDTTRFQIFVETLTGGQAEFTVGGIWIA